MPGLTVTEKDHWKNRIARRIDQRIEAIFAGEPRYQRDLQRQTYQKALESLGLAETQAELDAIEQQRKALAERENELQRTMLAKVRGVEPDEVGPQAYGSYVRTEIHQVVQRRREALEDELLTETDVGRRILQLRREKENLLDTVWLATSGKQIKDLWTKVAELLGETATQLEREALAITPEAAE